MLELIHISLKAGQHELLKHPVSLKENSGQTIAFFGRNGVGKTTLLKTIAGHLRNSTGEITAFGNNRESTSASQWARTCTYISSKDFMSQQISVHEFLLSARLGYTSGLGLYSKNDYAVTDRWIETLSLQPVLKKNYAFLSDGEKQLVSLARAFIYESPLILLDEPTSNLDVPNKKHITELLHNLSLKENKLIIYTTHDYYTSKPLCKNVWFISNNHEFLSGDFTALQSKIEHDFSIA